MPSLAARCLPMCSTQAGRMTGPRFRLAAATALSPRPRSTTTAVQPKMMPMMVTIAAAALMTMRTVPAMRARTSRMAPEMPMTMLLMVKMAAASMIPMPPATGMTAATLRARQTPELRTRAQTTLRQTARVTLTPVPTRPMMMPTRMATRVRGMRPTMARTAPMTTTAIRPQPRP